MNVAITPVLPANTSPAPADKATPNKPVNSKADNGKKGSFSDQLDNAVAQADAETAAENAATADPKLPVKLLINRLPINLLITSSNAADSQTSPESTDQAVASPSDAANPQQVPDSIPTPAMMDPALLAALVVAPTLSTVPDNTGNTTDQAAVPAVGVSTPNPAPAPLAVNLPAVPVPADNLEQPVAAAATAVTTAATNQAGTLQELIAQILQKDQGEGAALTAGTAADTQSNAVTSKSGPVDPVQPLPVDSKTIAAVMPAVATVQQVQLANAKPAVSANKLPTEAAPQSADLPPTPVVAVSHEQPSLQQGFTGEGQQQDAAGENTHSLSQAKVVQDLKVTTIEGSAPQDFAQSLQAVLSPANGTAAANTVETTPNPAPFADVHQVADQIIEQTKIITKPQNTEMIIKLKPEHLGELTLKVAVENGVVNASFHSNNAEVRNIIEASLPQLKQELSNTGLKVDNVSVYAGLSQFLPNHGQDRGSRQQAMKFTNKKSAEDFVEAIDGELTEAKTAGIYGETGVDYRI